MSARPASSTAWTGAGTARRRRDDPQQLLDARPARGVAARFDRERHVHRARHGRLAACVRQRAAVVGVRVRERRTSFQVSGVPIARDSAVLEAGIDANVTKRA
ncbi:hypothetical protein WT97_29525 [Burkholderia sp. MSMB1459WGS]|nr:hypothetical protein WT24_28285 [Burkholderia sp. MSMB1078WGS]KWO36597.1 hypothetical protein WT97_29525 [Burkholderia sp. MSMB1459WGS]